MRSSMTSGAAKAWLPNPQTVKAHQKLQFLKAANLPRCKACTLAVALAAALVPERPPHEMQ